MSTRDSRPLVDNAVSMDAIGTSIRDDALQHYYSWSRKQRIVRFYIADVPAHVKPWSGMDMSAMKNNTPQGGMFKRSDLLAWTLSRKRPVAAIEFTFVMDEGMKLLQKLTCRLVDAQIQVASTFEAVYRRLKSGKPESAMFEGLLQAAIRLGARTSSQNFGEGRKKGYVGDRMMNELSLFANTELTCYCLRHGIPVIYRNSFSFERVPHEVKELYFQDRQLALSRRERPVNLGPHMHSHVPRWHMGLDLEGYAEFTSPLRSFISIVNLRQVRAHLLGEVLPYTVDEIRLLSQEVDMLQWRRLFAAREMVEETAP